MSLWHDQQAVGRRHVLRAFGRSATYTPSGGDPVTVTVILDANPGEAEGEYWRFQNGSPDVTADVSDVPKLGAGDTFEIDGTTYLLQGAPPQADAGGLVTFPVVEQ